MAEKAGVLTSALPKTCEPLRLAAGFWFDYDDGQSCNRAFAHKRDRKSMKIANIEIAVFTAVLLLAACSGDHNVRVPEVEATIGTSGAIRNPVATDPSVVPPLASSSLVSVHLVLLDRTLEIAPDVRYKTVDIPFVTHLFGDADLGAMGAFLAQ
jgi:hypothetical protein